jgi:hypothetical protein
VTAVLFTPPNSFELVPVSVRQVMHAESVNPVARDGPLATPALASLPKNSFAPFFFDIRCSSLIFLASIAEMGLVCQN